MPKKGYNFLVYKEIKYILNRFLKSELSFMKNNSVEILALEKKHEKKISINEISNRILLKGVIDRVDLVNEEKIRLIDYKTGNISRKYKDKLNISNDELFTPENYLIIQLLFYSLIYENKNNLEIEAYIFGIKKSDYKFSLNISENRKSINIKIDNELRNNFEQQLIDLLNKIYNLKTSFVNLQ